MQMCDSRYDLNFQNTFLCEYVETRKRDNIMQQEAHGMQPGAQLGNNKSITKHNLLSRFVHGSSFHRAQRKDSHSPKGHKGPECRRSPKRRPMTVFT